ncbi:MAG: hypothetical protein RLY70_3411 [Planctomycetota bacterium]
MRGLRGMRDSGRMASLGPTSEKKREVPGTNCLAARRHRRATPNARSGSKPASPSVDGQDVRRTMKGRAISIRPLDSQSPVRTSINRLYDGHLIRREHVAALSIPPPPSSNTQRTFRLEACQPQRRRTAGPSVDGQDVRLTKKLMGRTRSGQSIPNRLSEHRSTVCTTDILSVESSSRNFRFHRHRRATPNARSGSKQASPSVDGQDVRRTKNRRAISIRPLDSQSPVRTSINRLYDGHLVRRELVGELSNPPPPASDTPRTFRLEAGRPQRRRTRCPSYKGERSVPGTNSVLAERSVPGTNSGTNSVLAERSVPGTNSVLLAL